LKLIVTGLALALMLLLSCSSKVTSGGDDKDTEVYSL